MSVAWDLAQGWTVHQIPSSLPPLYLGDSLVVFGVLTPSSDTRLLKDNTGSKEIRAQATLKGTVGSLDTHSFAFWQKAAIKHVIQFTITLAVDGSQGHSGSFHCLAAKSLIREQQDGYSDTSQAWSDGKKVETKERVISVSKAANVISKFTSFIAVDEESHQPVSGPMRKRPGVWEESDDDFIGSSDDECDELLFENVVVRDCVDEDVTVYEEKSSNLPLSALPREKLKGTSAGMALHALPQSVMVGYASPPRKSYKAPPAPVAAYQKKKEAPAVLSLISLQKASGAWDLTDQLVSLCGTSRDVLITGCLTEIAIDTAEGKLLWATALALVLLTGKFLDQKDEWEMIAEKGKKWMKKNLPAAVKYDNVLAFAAKAVGVQI